MKTLLRRMLCTQDDKVFDILIEKGWPTSFYTIGDCVGDLRYCEDIRKVRAQVLDVRARVLPIKLLQRYNIELAKTIVKGSYKYAMISCFAHVFLTRELTQKEIDEVLNEGSESKKRETKGYIDYLNRQFKLCHSFDKLYEQKKSEET